MKRPIPGGLTVVVAGLSAQLPALAYFDGSIWAITALGVPNTNLISVLSQQQLDHLYATLTKESKDD